MTFSKQVTIWCDSCGDWDQLSTGSVIYARKQLKKTGWKCKSQSDKRDLCPRCKEAEAEKRRRS